MNQPWPDKLDHVSLPVTDLEAAKRFYAAALKPIGIEPLGGSDNHAAFGIGHMPYLIIHRSVERPASVHLAFKAEQRAQVDEFHAAGLEAGGKDYGAPGIRENYHPNYYGAFLLDPDGHNIEVVKHAPE